MAVITREVGPLSLCERRIRVQTSVPSEVTEPRPKWIILLPNIVVERSIVPSLRNRRLSFSWLCRTLHLGSPLKEMRSTALKRIAPVLHVESPPAGPGCLSMTSAYVPQIVQRGRSFLVGGLVSAEYPIEEALFLKPVSALKDGTADKLDISQDWCACLSFGGSGVRFPAPCSQ